MATDVYDKGSHILAIAVSYEDDASVYCLVSGQGFDINLFSETLTLSPWYVLTFWGS